eukprot:724647-Pyramimonas_sp.AAC.1
MVQTSVVIPPSRQTCAFPRHGCCAAMATGTGTPIASKNTQGNAEDKLGKAAPTSFSRQAGRGLRGHAAGWPGSCESLPGAAVAMWVSASTTLSCVVEHLPAVDASPLWVRGPIGFRGLQNPLGRSNKYLDIGVAQGQRARASGTNRRPAGPEARSRPLASKASRA